MPRYLRWLSGSALAFTGLTLAVLVFGPVADSGNETSIALLDSLSPR